MTPGNLRQLSDQKLIEATDRVVSKERELLVSVLEHLREIERRRLFSALGFSSLWEYTIKRLKYSEDQAQRRISAMRLLKELPEIEEKIESGALTLTNLGLAQSLFRQEAKSKPLARGEKTALLKQLEHKSKREAEKIVLQQSTEPIMLKPDRVKMITENQVLVQFMADPSLLPKIERLKGLLAHSHPQLTMAELIGKLCDLGLQKWDPMLKPQAKARVKSDDRATALITQANRAAATAPSTPNTSPAPEQVEAVLKKAVVNSAPARVEKTTRQQPVKSVDHSAPAHVGNTVSQTSVTPAVEPANAHANNKTARRPEGLRRYISAALRQEVWHRAGGRCSKCGSQRKLEIEHKRPVAMGGGNDLKNLTLLCRSCNQRAAIEQFGLRKMESHLKPISIRERIAPKREGP